jgi:hypothetical protein
MENERAVHIKKPLDAWKQEGVVSLWRYSERQRNFPGWHLSADHDGVASLLSLLKALGETESGIARTVSLTPPSHATLAVPNNGNARWLAPERLRVSRSDDPAMWCLAAWSDPAELIAGLTWLAKLSSGIADIARGHGDYSIGDSKNGNLQLWFWWQPDSRSAGR